MEYKIKTPAASILKIAKNYSNLPSLNPLEVTKVRSTWALLLTILASLAPFMGGGIGELVSMILVNADAIEAGGTQLIESVNSIIATIAVVWLWLERRNPNFKLSFK